jgi:hypothetical protein
MKKYTILFALLTGMILLAFEAVPQYRAFSLSNGCVDPKTGGSIPCPPSGSSGGPEKPGPKNHPTSVATPVPTKAPTPVPLVMFGPTVPPIVLGGPKPTPYPYPILPHIANQNLCQLGPCWPFGIQPGDPVELLAGGGFLAFLVVIGFVLFRGRNAQGGGGGSIQ